eukprot:scaffold35372_cov59-Attheya_sp.AAC.5
MADEAMMIISNQKNGIRGDQLHHEANGTEFCPVKALAHRIHCILSNGGTEESVLSTYFDDDGEITFLRGDDIVKGICPLQKYFGDRRTKLKPPCLAFFIDVIFFCATFKIPFCHVSAGLATNLNTDSSLGGGTRPALHCAGPSGPTCRGSASDSGVVSKHAQGKRELAL